MPCHVRRVNVEGVFAIITSVSEQGGTEAPAGSVVDDGVWESASRCSNGPI